MRRQRPTVVGALLALALLLAGCATPPRGDAPRPAAGAAAGPAIASATPAAAVASAAAQAMPPSTPAPAPVAPEPPLAASAEPQPEDRPTAPRARLDPEQDAERGDLWRRIRHGFAVPDLDGPLVRKWEQHYAGQPQYVQRLFDRGARYLFHIVEEIERRQMPLELALLPVIESAFNPQALSRARAAGMWQFMPATGVDFQLRQNLFRDDRRDVLASTRAALDYLQRLHSRFGDWHLALAAYNWGQGNVQRAIERNQRARLPTDYDSLRGLPRETRDYVPKLQAVKNIVRDPASFALALPPLPDHPYFVTVAIERDIDVELVAQLAGLDLDDFRSLNPQLNKPVILAAGTPQILLPYDNANRFVRELAGHRGALASWTAWVAPRTLKPVEAARLVGMSEAELRELNRVPPRMLVQAGSTLLVPRPEHVQRDVDERTADHATLQLAPEGRPARRVVLRAGRQGESVHALARRHGVLPAQIAQWNNVAADGRFRPGASIVLMLPARTARAVSPGRGPQAAARAANTKGTKRPTAQPSARPARAPAKPTARPAAR